MRRAPVAEPAELEAPLDWLAHALAREDRQLFSLSGYSPAMHETPVLLEQRSMVPAFLSTSRISWNFGRNAVDPTHEVLFFNPEKESQRAVLRLSFVACGEASTGPGLVAELVLGTDAAGPADSTRSEHLDRLFSMLVSAFGPDYGHVELPGYTGTKERPGVYDVGWLTYFSRAERKMPATLKPPALIKRTEGGWKIFATAALGMECHADMSRAIDNVRDQIRITSTVGESGSTPK